MFLIIPSRSTHALIVGKKKNFKKSFAEMGQRIISISSVQLGVTHAP